MTTAGDLNRNNPQLYPGVTGGVVGPASATDNALARFDGTTGKLVKDSPNLTYDGTNLTLAAGLVTARTAPPSQVLSGTTIAMNAASGSLATWTLTGNSTFAVPTNMGEGEKVEVYITQAASGGPYTVDFHDDLTWPVDVEPAVSTTASAVDYLTIRRRGTAYYAELAPITVSPLAAASVVVTDANGLPQTDAQITFDGTQLRLSDTTDSSSITTGALRVDGGVGIAEKLYVGDRIHCLDTTAASGAANTGALRVGSQSGGDYVNIGGGILALGGAGGVSIYMPNGTAFRNSTSGGGGNLYLDCGSLNVRDGNGSNAFGQLRVGAGSATTPTISFNGDTNTGFYNAFADTLYCATGGVERWRVGSTGEMTFDNGSTLTGPTFIRFKAAGGSSAYVRFAEANIGAQTADLAYLQWQRDGSQGRQFSVYISTNGGVSTESLRCDYLGNTNILVRANLASVAGSTTNGDLWQDSTQKAVQTYVNSVEQTLGGCLFTMTASATVGNTVTETTLIGTGVGTLTLPANFLVAGKKLRIRCHGRISSDSANSLTLRFKLGSTTLATAVVTWPFAANTDTFVVEAELTCRTTGGTGTASACVRTLIGWAAASDSCLIKSDQQVPTIDTTASAALNVTAQWGGSNAADLAEVYDCSVEVLN